MPQSPNDVQRDPALVCAERFVMPRDALLVLRVLDREGRGVTPELYHLVQAIVHGNALTRSRLRVWNWAPLVEAVELYESDDGRAYLYHLAGWELRLPQLNMVVDEEASAAGVDTHSQEATTR